MLTDTHCHLDMIPDEKIALLRAKEAGVGTIINVGTSIDASKKSIEIAQGTDLVDVYATCGIHAQEGPKDIKRYGSLDKCIEVLKQLILDRVEDDKKKVVAIGECGLDFFLDATSQGPATSDQEKKDQKELFEKQIDLAIELGLPLIIHCRNAWDETFELIEKYSSSESKTSREVQRKFSTLRFNSGRVSSNNKQSMLFSSRATSRGSNNNKTDSGPFGKTQGKQALRLHSGQFKGNERSRIARMTGAVRGLFHSWTGTVEQAKRALDLGFYISISGIVTFKNSGEIPGVVKMVPDDRILVETDSPFLSPVPLRGKQNEPKNVKITAQFVASLRGVSLDTISEITTRNAESLFRLSEIRSTK